MNLSIVIAYLFTAAIPAGAFYLIWALDLYGTGRFRTLALCFAWGLAGAFLLSNASLTVLLGLGVAYITVVTFVAPLLEETFKALVLIYLITRPVFRYIVDGALYGFAAGIGFGVAETMFIYLPNNPNAALVSAISRSLSAILMHAGASALVGVSLGRLRRARKVRLTAAWVVLGIALAVTAHLIYNNMAYRLGSQPQALLLFGVGFGLVSVALIGWLIRQGLEEEKQRFNETLGLGVGVSTGERKAVQQLGGAAFEQAVGELSASFGVENVGLIRRMLVVQANIGILQNNLSYPVSDRLRAAWEAEIAQLRAESESIRRQLGAYVRSYLNQVFPTGDPAFVAQLEEEFARSDPTLVHTFDMFMRESELAQAFTAEQLAAMAERLNKTEIFRHVSLAHLENLSRAIETVALDDGQTLFNQGDEGDAMYLVEAGGVDIFTRYQDGREERQRTFGPGDVVGEFALLDGAPRSASARANGPARLLRLQRQVFMRFISSRPDVITAMLRYLAGKLRHTTDLVEGQEAASGGPEPLLAPAAAGAPSAGAPDGTSLAQRLQESVVFRGIETPVLEALVKVMDRRTFSAGEVLFEKPGAGAPVDQLPDSLCFILSGRVRIYLPDEQGGERTFRYYGPNEIVGEVALLDQQPRSASGAAAEPLDVLALNRENFLRFLDDHRRVGLAMMRNMTGRIRYTQNFLESMSG